MALFKKLKKKTGHTWLGKAAKLTYNNNPLVFTSNVIKGARGDESSKKKARTTAIMAAAVFGGAKGLSSLKNPSAKSIMSRTVDLNKGDQKVSLMAKAAKRDGFINISKVKKNINDHGHDSNDRNILSTVKEAIKNKASEIFKEPSNLPEVEPESSSLTKRQERKLDKKADENIHKAAHLLKTRWYIPAGAIAGILIVIDLMKPKRKRKFFK